MTILAERCPGLTSVDFTVCGQLTDAAVTILAERCPGQPSASENELVAGEKRVVGGFKHVKRGRAACRRTDVVMLLAGTPECLEGGGPSRGWLVHQPIATALVHQPSLRGILV